MTHIEALKQALIGLERCAVYKLQHESIQNIVNHYAPALRQAIADAEKQELVAVKHMMDWVAFLKARSDNGQHKQIPSNLSAGACWDLAVELEQFINTNPQPKREWVGLTNEEIVYELGADNEIDIAWAHEIEAKLKEKNT